MAATNIASPAYPPAHRFDLKGRTEAEIETAVANWHSGLVQQVAAPGPDELTRSEVQDAIRDLQLEAANLTRVRDDETEIEIGQAVDDVLTWLGAPTEINIVFRRPQTRVLVDRNTDEYRFLFDCVRRSRLALVEREMARLLGERQHLPSDPLFRNTRKLRSSTRADTLDTLIRDFSEDPRKRGWSEKTRLDYGTVFRLLRQAIGSSRPLAEIDRSDLRRVQKLVLSVPSNAAKKFPQLTIEAAVIAADEQDLPRLSPKSVNSYLAKTSTLFNWAEKEGRIGKSPARGLLIQENNGTRREPFSTEQLRAIFGAPLFTGCVDDQAHYARPGPNRPRRARFWIPLLSLLHGLRLNEACQLSLDDVAEEGSIPLIRVREGRPDQRIKTASGTRDVPLHPEIMAMGFLDFVQERRSAGDPRLFPELQRDGRGYYSDAFQKWFARFLTSCGAKRPHTSFHSFRHAWRDALRRADVPLQRAQALGGWKEGGADAGYGHGEPLEKLAVDIAKIGYPGLDLSRLIP